MNILKELKRILAINAEDRTQKELDFLEKHKSHLTDKMVSQLEDEANVDEVYTASFAKKSLKSNNPLKKNIGKKIIRNFSAKVKDLGDGMMEAIVSSEAEDRHGEILDMKGLDVGRYMQNPIVSYLHQHSVPSVGRTHRLTKTKDGKLKAQFEWAIKGNLKELHEKARLLYELYKEGFQFAFSIEFIPQEIDGNRFTKSEMVGFAPVVVPANPEALLLAKSKGLDNVLLTTYNEDTMNIQALLKKIKEQGIEALTLAEVKFLKDHKDDLTGNQLKELAPIFKEDANNDDEPETDPSLKAIQSLTETVKSLASDVAEIKNVDPVQPKNIGQDPEDKSFNVIERYKTINGVRVHRDYVDSDGNPTKESKLYHYVKGLMNKDLRSYINLVGKDAMNTSDDSVVLPPAEFIVEVQRLEEEVGVAMRDATIRRSSTGNGLKYVLGDDDLEIFDTAEGGVKKSTALSYAQKLLAWRKFAGILPITDELTEDAGFDLWNDATQRFARAYAKRADQLVFTETATTGNTKDGILNVSGVNTVTLTGDGFEDITYDALVEMIYGVPSPSGNRGKFYLNRDILPHIMKLKDDENRPLWLPSIRDGAPPTILGRPYEEVDVMPGTSDNAADTEFMAYGYLKYATLGERTDIQMKMFDAGTVGDPDEVDQDANTLNLLTQDIQALRAVKRMNAVVRFPAAFSVLKTGAGS